MANIIDRVIRSAKLDPKVYEEVEADKTAMGQAMGVVICSGLAAGIGMMAVAGTAGLISGAVAALIGWFVWALLTYVIGTRFFPEPQTKSDLGELLRTIGFSSSPGLIRILGIVPIFGGIIFFVAHIWMLAAMVIAVRQALDYTKTSRAVLVCFIGWVVQVIIVMLLAGLR